MYRYATRKWCMLMREMNIQLWNESIDKAIYSLLLKLQYKCSEE